MNLLVRSLLLAAFTLAVLPALADDPKPAPKSGLTAALVAEKDTYALDAAQTGAEAAKRIKAAAKAGRPVAAPKVDLVLRVTNNTDHKATFNFGGDDSQIALKLEGPGAVVTENMVAMTMEFRMGATITLDPGKSHDIPIKSLNFGARNLGGSAYWTEPGDYTLTATLTTNTPDDVVLKLTSEPLKLKITAAK